MGTLPAGSYLAVAHPTLEVTGEKVAVAIAYWYQHGTPPGTHRTPALRAEQRTQIVSRRQTPSFT
jgi:hypothetical protein